MEWLKPYFERTMMWNRRPMKLKWKLLPNKKPKQITDKRMFRISLCISFQPFQAEQYSTSFSIEFSGFIFVQRYPLHMTFVPQFGFTLRMMQTVFNYYVHTHAYWLREVTNDPSTARDWKTKFEQNHTAKLIMRINAASYEIKVIAKLHSVEHCT